ncbi:phage late control D family protein [Bartonella sp. HY761]|uniref:phage late control D family protein n=1 Tax=Bartonella sp. HY761 TaxID=2979330 RepID=UPI0021F99FEA|nr:contractile injection system protein, VgrG/Pvc8 family [Bartonella sp. HY761]UXN07507.1 contractile injection system protein, VgrG/Pvc8 family [Bartonella sp. HY761]
MKSVREPSFVVKYQGMDVSAEFGGYTTSITYTDKRHGESDECSLKMQNADGKWLGEYAPQDGDTMEVWYGYSDELVYAGKFTIDEWSVSGDSGGDTIEIKGLSAPKTQSLRTKNTKAFETQSLSDIVQKIAKAHGLKVEGEIEDIKLERVTQHGERDLEFLKRLADDYGHYFTVKGNILVFTSRDGLRARDPIYVVDRLAEAAQMLKSYDLSFSDHKAAQKAEVKYSHPQRKALVGQEASSVDDLGVVTSSGDVMKIDVRVENEEQAKRVAKSRLDAKNAQKITGTLNMVGVPTIVAGAVIELKNFGVFDGRYLVVQSEHNSSRSGYEMSADIERATGKNIEDGKKVKNSAKTKKSGNSASASNSSTSGVDFLGTVQGDGSVRG